MNVICIFYKKKITNIKTVGYNSKTTGKTDILCLELLYLVAICNLYNEFDIMAIIGNDLQQCNSKILAYSDKFVMMLLNN